jgi:AmmeMemoRadiSam system protein B/AmmeMemoRadiSam system protein A
MSEKVFSTVCAVFLIAVLCIAIAPAKLEAEMAKETTHRKTPTEKNRTVREPAVAGTFYPAGTEELETMVDGYLREAALNPPSLGPEDEILMILVPHAGYVYSGRTASYAFSAIRGREYDTVILLGCPHRVPVRGAAVYCGDGFRIPLGTVPVNRELAQAIIDASDLIVDDATPHLPEHSLEVELPFLSMVLEDYTIVPILLSGDAHTLELVSQAVVDGLRRVRGSSEGVLFVISTDLAHYPRHEDAERSDRAILDAFCTLDTQNLVSVNNEIMGSGIDGLQCTMCGLEAAYVGIRIANMTGGEVAKVLHTSTSADAGIAASDERTVGYGSVIVTGHRKPLSDRFEPLKKEEGEFLLQIARNTLFEYLNNERVPDPVLPLEYTEHLTQQRGLFVTLYKQGALRGCIGNHVTSLPLYRAVQYMVLQSALNDPRFPPLLPSEIDEVRIELSVYLSRVEPISSVKEYVPGKHGIILKNGSRSATFLPKVPIEQGWDKKQTLCELSKKAGLPQDAWKDNTTRFSVYETQLFFEE